MKRMVYMMETQEDNCLDSNVSFYYHILYCIDGNPHSSILMVREVFMLQADVLPNMGFSATRKRLIHSHDCLSNSNFVKEKENELEHADETHDFRMTEEL